MIKTPKTKESRRAGRNSPSNIWTPQYRVESLPVSNQPQEREIPFWWYVVMVFGVFFAGSIDSLVNLALRFFGA